MYFCKKDKQKYFIDWWGKNCKKQWNILSLREMQTYNLRLVFMSFVCFFSWGVGNQQSLSTFVILRQVFQWVLQLWLGTLTSASTGFWHLDLGHQLLCFPSSVVLFFWWIYSGFWWHGKTSSNISASDRYAVVSILAGWQSPYPEDAWRIPFGSKGHPLSLSMLVPLLYSVDHQTMFVRTKAK